MDKSKEHWDLVLQVAKEWNNLPVEERKKYIVFSVEASLKVLCQVKTLCKDDMSPNCKKKITKWANNIADSLKQEFKEYLSKYGMSNEEKYLAHMQNLEDEARSRLESLKKQIADVNDKALEIIRKKDVITLRLKYADSVERYNKYLPEYMHLNQEEYKTLKEVIGNESRLV